MAPVERLEGFIHGFAYKNMIMFKNRFGSGYGISH